MKLSLEKLVNCRMGDISKTIFHKALFFIFRLFPVNLKKVVFLTLHSDVFSGNNKLIYDELIKRDLDFEYILYGMDDIKLSNLGKWGKIIKTIQIDFNISTARYIILNDFYSLFTRVKIRKDTDLIQVWHGGGAFKKFGKHSLRNISDSKRLKRYVYGSTQYAKVIVSSKEVVGIFADAFGIDLTKIYAIGLPRADVFFDNNMIQDIKQKFFDKHVELLDKKIILYAPTFRDDEKYNYKLRLDLQYMMNNLKDDHIIILKMHPIMKGRIKIDKYLSSKVFNLSDEDINELLIIADILITDYSSLIFEYAILQKPMIFFAYDLENYENDLRGFYYNYIDFIPGPIAYTTEEIVKLIIRDEWDLDRIKGFAMRFNEYFDGKSTKRFVEDVLLSSK